MIEILHLFIFNIRLPTIGLAQILMGADFLISSVCFEGIPQESGSLILQFPIIYTSGQAIFTIENIINHRKLFMLLIFIIFILLMIVMSLIFMKNKQKFILHKEIRKHKIGKENALGDKKRVEKELLEEQKLSLEKKREITYISLRIANERKQLTDFLKTSSSQEISLKAKERIIYLMNQKEYWEFFNKKFVEVHPDFSTGLKDRYPQLTEKDIQFCILLKLKLTNKEIAQLLNINNESVISKKYRLRKKIEIQNRLEEFFE